MDQKLPYNILRNSEGLVIGIELNRLFAFACDATVVTEEAQIRCLEYIWATCKPAPKVLSKVPSGIVWWGNGTLLPTLFQHHSDRGKWLEIIPTSLTYGTDEEPVVYECHHALDYLDNVANQWLCRVFAQWVTCTQVELASMGLKVPG